MPKQQIENTNLGREDLGLETRHCVDSQVRSLTARRRDVRGRARGEKSVDSEFSVRQSHLSAGDLFDCRLAYLRRFRHAHSLSRSACLPGLAPGSFGSSPMGRTSDCGQVWRTCTTTLFRYGAFGGSRFAEPGGIRRSCRTDNAAAKARSLGTGSLAPQNQASLGTPDRVRGTGLCT